MSPSSATLHNTDSREYKKAQRQFYKTTKNRPPNIESEWTPFRAAEKRYKARFPPPDLSDVLDLAAADPNRLDEIKKGVWVGRQDAVACKLLSSDGQAKVYAVPSIPGLVILPSYLSSETQSQLVRWAIAKQACYPNETNLDIHYSLPREGIWNAYVNARNDPSNDVLILPKVCETDLVEREPPGPRTLISNTPASEETFQTISVLPKPPQAPSDTIKPTLSSTLLYKLRWANIGWYYHWGTKQYDFTKGKGVIDERLRQICKSAVNSVDWQQAYEGSDVEWDHPEWKAWDTTYEPDAGIVNFYQTKDTLMGHVDRSEVCATSPLVSISLGNAAVFLIGGPTRDSEPIPILLRSGDVLIMSGTACRRSYHGVPRILEGTLPPHLQASSLGSRKAAGDWEPYEEYLCTTRINVNVRQVFPIGFDPSKITKH